MLQHSSLQCSHKATHQQQPSHKRALHLATAADLDTTVVDVERLHRGEKVLHRAHPRAAPHSPPPPPPSPTPLRPGQGPVLRLLRPGQGLREAQPMRPSQWPWEARPVRPSLAPHDARLDFPHRRVQSKVEEMRRPRCGERNQQGEAKGERKEPE
ncbi:hypothetical protein GUJ93_ZPchr0012g21130 [Zizania palustris]|uniref:Uncharacterized protein n=1 Tax=Zizania palustris TaxID=103762 RepID=A0A8J6BSM8_ZIZPA|nr:hypothetical protein GUJ93_ZPchr0012g21130 [Zizania palustris]